MNGYYLSKRLDNERLLCVAPLSNRNIALSGQEVDDPSGYFLFEKHGSDDNYGVTILAHLVSEEAALQMGMMLEMA